MGSQATEIRSLPLFVRRDQNGGASAIPVELEKALVLLFFGRSGVHPESVSKLYWPFILAPLDKRHHILVDMLNIHDATVRDYPSPSCMEKLESLGDLSPSLDTYDDIVARISSLPGASRYAPKGANLQASGCLQVASINSGLPEYLSSVGQATGIGEHQVLAARLSSNEGIETVTTVRTIWQNVHSDLAQLASATTAIETAETAWTKFFYENRSAVGKRYAEKIAKIRPEVDQRIEEARNLIEKELHDIDIKLSPEISLLEAEASKLAREEERIVRTGRDERKARQSIVNARQNAENQLARMTGERDRLMSLVRGHHGKTIAREEDRILAYEESRDEETQQLDVMQTQLISCCKHALETLAPVVSERQNHLLSVAPLVLEVPEKLAHQLPEKNVLTLLPFWIASFQQGRSSTVKFVFPSYIGVKPTFGDHVRMIFTGECIPRDRTLRRFSKVLKEGLLASSNADVDFAQALLSKASAANTVDSTSFAADMRLAAERLLAEGWITRKRAATMNGA